MNQPRPSRPADGRARLDAAKDRRALPRPRDSIEGVGGLAPAPARCPIDLSDNTNLFGAPPSAVRAMAQVPPAALTRYPSPYADDLKRALAEYHDVPVACVTTGCGSDGVLDAAIRAFAEPGDRLAYPEPTFSMIPVFARVNGLESVPVACAGAVDAGVVEAMFRAGPRVVYLCGPNNPTGARVSPDAIEAVRERWRGGGPPGQAQPPRDAEPPLVILDQAYAEFDEDERPFRPFGVSEPALVTRTLSKAFGLAGLRIGYGIGPAEIVAAIEKVRGPYQVGAAAERIAVEALTHDLEWMRAQVGEAIAQRGSLVEQLRAIGLHPLPSAANFVLVPVVSAATAAERLSRAGVAVRPFPALPGIGDAVRITVGPRPMWSACVAALREIAT